MKLHTALTEREIFAALYTEKRAGRISEDVYFWQFRPEPSRTHAHGFLIQLGTDDQYSFPGGNSRNIKNSGASGAVSHIWAATYYEWGWLIARIFDLDPTAAWDNYASREDFNAQTHNIFTDLPYAVVDTTRNELRRKIRAGQKARVMARFATTWEAGEFIAEAPEYYRAGYAIESEVQ